MPIFRFSKSTIICAFALMAIVLYSGLLNANDSFGDVQDESIVDDKMPEGIKFSVIASKDNPTVNELNSGNYKVKVRIENKSKTDVVLWPFMKVDVFDKDMKPVKKAMNGGRFGRRRTNSILESISFVELKPGQTHEIEVKLDKYGFHPTSITGWKFSDPGKFHLALHYQFNQDDVKKDFGKGCTELDLPHKPWNQALEMDKTEMIELNVVND